MNGCPGVGARRGDVDDAAPAGLDHVGQHGLGGVEDPVQVDVDDLAPFIEGDVGEAPEDLFAGGVDQDRHRAQCTADLGERGINLVAVGDVGEVGVLGVRRVEVDCGDVVAVGAQSMRDCRSDSRTPTGHQSGLHRQSPSRWNSGPYGARSRPYPIASLIRWISVVKNLPFRNENATLAVTHFARHSDAMCLTAEMLRRQGCRRRHQGVLTMRRRALSSRRPNV